jgi:hypothetical protein
MVDPVVTGDAQCLGDRAGDRAPFSPVFQGYQISFGVTAGFYPMFAINSDGAAFTKRIVAGPEGRMWVLDEGDASSVIRGQVLSFSPGAADSGFGVVRIR